jgi:AcrR family transcriptional regulator
MDETARVGGSPSSRVNQKTRTRAALLAAAGKLVREGRPPSMPDAAAEALVSVATAYRYFATADDLWAEASIAAADIDGWLEAAHREIEAAGRDPVARAEVAARVIGGRMLDDPLPFRQLVKAGMDQWFAQHNDPKVDRVPVRAGRRTRTNTVIVEPLRGTLSEEEIDRLVRALGLVSGTDPVLALTDTLNLDRDDAMVTLLDANRWLITGALAEARARRRRRDAAPHLNRRHDAATRGTTRGR